MIATHRSRIPLTNGGKGIVVDYQLSLRYSGPAVESGQMDVYDTAANMIAFSEFVVEAARTAYGKDADVKAKVSGFTRGSFVTAFIINVVGPTATILSSVDARSLLELVSQGINLWKFLQGAPPKSTREVTNSDGVQYLEVENNNGEITQVNINTLQLVYADKATESVGKFVRDSLSKPGMDGLEIKTGKQLIAKASQAESGYFISVRPEDKVTDAIIKMALTIEAPVFKEDNKWRFYDGQSSIYAEIRDLEFLSRVNHGELFGKGDILIVDLRIVQMQSGTKISIERSIVKVHDHKHAMIQKPLI